MGDWLTIVLMIGAVVFALGLGWVMGADYGYRRGWLMGEKSSATRTRRQLELCDERVAHIYAREAHTIERLTTGPTRVQR